MNDRTLAQIARNIIAGFMLTLGIIPNAMARTNSRDKNRFFMYTS